MTVTHTEKLDKTRIIVHLDNGEHFAVYHKEAEHLGLETDRELTQLQYQEILVDILIPRAKKRAMYLLEKMDRTEAQLREKLRQGCYPDIAIEEAISYVKKFHYVDDFRYACNYVRSHGPGSSRRRLMMELTGKGISGELVRQALETEYTGEERLEILRWMEKKQYDPGQADLRQKQKMYQFLLRKGFRSEDILKELK